MSKVRVKRGVELYSRKGFLFSLFVITALSLVVLSFKMRVEFMEENRAEIFEKRVEETNFFIKDMKGDIERSLYVASFRAFLGMDEYIHIEEDYIEDINKSIKELVLNGTIDGRQMNSTNSSTFNYWIESVRELAKRFRINITFNDITIDVEHASPWTLRITMSSNISVADFENIIEWNFTLSEYTIIDISEAGFPDPVYFVESISNYEKNKGKMDRAPLLNNIGETEYSVFWWNSTTYPAPNASFLADHTQRQLYKRSQYAPSFLMRLSGEFDCGSPSDSECTNYGIESFVDIADSSIWDFSANGTATCAPDYQFFSEGCVGDKHRIISMDDKFYLDWNHVVDYVLTEINRSAG